MKLVYDVGMNNGDDTAYYLHRGYRVLAIEANPELIATATSRFRREIKLGALNILNVGVAAADGESSFWISETNTRLSSFDPRDASLGGLYNIHEIHIPSRTFRSILDEYGVPHFMKIDIQGNDRLCIEALDGAKIIPKFLSIEFMLTDTSLLALLQRCGFSQFKCISQLHFLPLELPLVPAARQAQRAERLLRSRNIFVRAFRKFGGRRWLQRQLARLRTCDDGWIFPTGSSGPFGDDLPGRWLTYHEFDIIAQQFMRLRRQAPQTLLWAPAGYCPNPFWVDLHARVAE